MATTKRLHKMADDARATVARVLAQAEGVPEDLRGLFLGNVWRGIREAKMSPEAIAKERAEVLAPVAAVDAQALSVLLVALATLGEPLGAAVEVPMVPRPVRVMLMLKVIAEPDGERLFEVYRSKACDGSEAGIAAAYTDALGAALDVWACHPGHAPLPALLRGPVHAIGHCCCTDNCRPTGDCSCICEDCAEARRADATRGR